MEIEAIQTIDDVLDKRIKITEIIHSNVYTAARYTDTAGNHSFKTDNKSAIKQLNRIKNKLPRYVTIVATGNNYYSFI